MAAPTNQSSSPPEFPYWPFNCLSLYTHMVQDFGQCAQELTKTTDAMEAAHAEGEFGMRLFSDLMQGYYDLALAPLTAMASVIAERTEAAESPEPTEVKTTPGRRSGR